MWSNRSGNRVKTHHVQWIWWHTVGHQRWEMAQTTPWCPRQMRVRRKHRHWGLCHRFSIHYRFYITNWLFPRSPDGTGMPKADGTSHSMSLPNEKLTHPKYPCKHESHIDWWTSIHLCNQTNREKKTGIVIVIIIVVPTSLPIRRGPNKCKLQYYNIWGGHGKWTLNM